MGCGSSSEAPPPATTTTERQIKAPQANGTDEGQRTEETQVVEPPAQDKWYDPYDTEPSYDDLYGHRYNPYVLIEGEHTNGDVVFPSIKQKKGKDTYADDEADVEEEKVEVKKMPKSKRNRLLPLLFVAGLTNDKKELEAEEEEKPAEKVEEKPPEKVEEKPAAKVEEKEEVKAEEKPEEKPDEPATLIGGITNRNLNQLEKDVGKAKDQHLDVRTSTDTEEIFTKPEVSGLYTDPKFSKETALGRLQGKCEWKRPSEFQPDAVLFSDGTSRFDIVQGGFGTCYFLSILSSLGDRPELIRKLLPADAWNPETGVVHVRLFWCGKWKDIYTDDYLPVVYDTTPWGARSSDPKEMWVSLLEKAYARFWGSYTIAESGQPENAFVFLTGGTSEPNDTKGANKAELWERIRNSINSGGIVAGSVPDQLDGVNGLAGGHAYSVTGATIVKTGGKQLRMIRVRNPWGTAKGEWKGDWSDGSAQWNSIPEEVKKEMMNTTSADGEFWMTMTDYCRHFRSAPICNITPDADGDGDPDPLYYTYNVRAEWKQGFDGGPNSMSNPRFLVTIPKSAKDSATGLCPFVVQLFQDADRRKPLSARCDVFRVVEKSKNADKLVLDDITADRVFWSDLIRSSRYQVPPGDYLINPRTFREGQHGAFCIRVFTTAATTLKHLEAMPQIYTGNVNNEIAVRQEIFTVDKLSSHFGRFEPGRNSGGQVGHDTCHTSPQYDITIPGSGSQPLRLTFMQAHQANCRTAIGFAFYPIGGDQSMPLDRNTIYTIHNSRIKGQFISGWSAEGVYQLKPGRYMLFLFTDSPNVDISYVLVLRSRDKLKVKAHNA